MKRGQSKSVGCLGHWDAWFKSESPGFFYGYEASAACVTRVSRSSTMRICKDIVETPTRHEGSPSFGRPIRVSVESRGWRKRFYDLRRLAYDWADTLLTV